MADGETYGEALQQVEIVIQHWLETAKTLEQETPQL